MNKFNEIRAAAPGFFLSIDSKSIYFRDCQNSLNIDAKWLSQNPGKH